MTTTLVALTLLFHVAVLILSISPNGKTLVDWELVRSPGTGIPTARIDRSRSTRRRRLLAVLGAGALAGGYSYYAFIHGGASDAVRQIGGAAYIAMLGARAFAKTMSIRMAIIGFLIFEVRPLPRRTTSR